MGEKEGFIFAHVAGFEADSMRHHALAFLANEIVSISLITLLVNPLLDWINTFVRVILDAINYQILYSAF